MSDYEGDWDNDWETVKSNINGVAPTIPPEPLLNYIGFKGSTLLSASNAAQEQRRKSRAPSVNILPSYRPVLQGLRPAIQTGHAHQQNGRSEVRRHVQQQAIDLNAYQRFLSNKSKPDGVYQMMHNFGEIARALPKKREVPEIEVAKDSLAEISVSNEAFIRAPGSDENILEIWGPPENVEKARKELSQWESYYRGPGTNHGRGRNNFSRTNAYDGRAVERLARQQLQDHEQSALQQYADDSMLPYEAHLIWPEKYDIQFFQEMYDKSSMNGTNAGSVLDELRRKYRCRITHEDDDRRETIVTADNYTNLLQVHNRLLGLMKEMVTKRKRGLRVTQCRLPDASNFKDQICLNTINLSRNFTAQAPRLCGAALPEQEIEQWNELKSLSDRQYRKVTKNAIRSCIKSLYVSQKHVRMRVSFGTVALKKWKQPSDRGDTYSIDTDFMLMITDPLVEVQQLPLVLGSTFDLVDRIDTIPEFQAPQLSWTIHFEFGGETGGHLRLEREYVPNYVDPDEPSIAATRWVTFSPNTTIDVNDLLEISHMVPGEVGYQVHVGSLGVHNNKKVKSELKDFEGKIEFRPSLDGDGLRSRPEKHTSFVRHSSLGRFTEITVARYAYKDTKGTFEIRRKDVFDGTDGFGATPSWTEWFATYYYAEWDLLMGDFANIEPGEDVAWSRDLSTFFPKINDENRPKLLPNGYKKFMKEVEGIRTLLNRAVEGINGSSVLESKGKGKALNGDSR